MFFNLADVLKITPGEEQEIIVQKSIGFITQHAFTNSCEHILQGLLRKALETNASLKSPLPIESFIYNLLFEVNIFTIFLVRRNMFVFPYI